MKRPAPMIGDGIMAYVCTAGVEDIDAMAAKALAAGGKVAMPKMPVPGVGWLAYFKDNRGQHLRHDAAGHGGEIKLECNTVDLASRPLCFNLQSRR